ncbi:hypothetical protein A2U01_0095680, partial [Trifolium medium]|nr:hypothetical protein [Trifolium medium]
MTSKSTLIESALVLDLATSWPKSPSARHYEPELLLVQRANDSAR